MSRSKSQLDDKHIRHAHTFFDRTRMGPIKCKTSEKHPIRWAPGVDSCWSSTRLTCLKHTHHRLHGTHQNEYTRDEFRFSSVAAPSKQTIFMFWLVRSENVVALFFITRRVYFFFFCRAIYNFHIDTHGPRQMWWQRGEFVIEVCQRFEDLMRRKREANTQNTIKIDVVSTLFFLSLVCSVSSDVNVTNHSDGRQHPS